VGLPTEAALAAKVGGARRDRTADLVIANDALSQLSYGPFQMHENVAIASISKLMAAI
jgi:hypothetical protein